MSPSWRTLVRFQVQGIPVAKGSPEILRRRRGRDGRPGRPFVREPEHQRAWQLSVAWAGRWQMNAERIARVERGPVAAVLTFTLPRPLDPRRPLDATVKPDIDKLERSVLDALTGVAYRDDSQVTSVLKWKREAEPGEQPGLFVALRVPRGEQ